MDKYPDSRPVRNPELKEAGVFPTLEFPVDRGFVSLPPRLEPHVMLRRIEETIRWRRARLGEPERRQAAAVDVEFVL